MKQKKHDNIKESQVEEALVSDLNYLRNLLNLEYDLKLIARQLRLKLGEQRLDILLSHGKELFLIELKVNKYLPEYIKQINEYRDELLKMQNDNKLLDGNIRAVLLVTGFNKKQHVLCEMNNIRIIKYRPLDVLNNYYDKLSLIAPFLKMKPKDYGVFNIGLINRALSKLRQGLFEESALAKELNLSKGSIHNHLRIANEFGLVRKRNKKYFLTDLGDKFVEEKNEEFLEDNISDRQTELLKRLIAKDPFYSSTVFGVYSIVESAFILSRNSYPIEFPDLKKIFRIVGGKVSDWQAEKSQQTATYTFLNFAVDLGLLGKIGQQIVITPEGFNFILMLQLHKSIKMIESLSLKQNEIEDNQ